MGDSNWLSNKSLPKNLRNITSVMKIIKHVFINDFSIRPFLTVCPLLSPHKVRDDAVLHDHRRGARTHALLGS